MAIGTIAGSFLISVETDFPDEADASYEYGGDLKRRERTAGSDTTWYNWGAGYAVMGEEDGSGNLQRTYVGNLAHIDGASAASGTYSYYWHDHLGSTRTLYDGAKAETASFDYAPYGDPLLHSHSAATTRLYTGHDWDAAAGLYFAPFRYYNPDLARWITREPQGLDGPNLYWYGLNLPTGMTDPTGLFAAAGAAGAAVGGMTGAFYGMMCGDGSMMDIAIYAGTGAAMGGLAGLGAVAIADLGAKFLGPTLAKAMSGILNLLGGTPLAVGAEGAGALSAANMPTQIAAGLAAGAVESAATIGYAAWVNDGC